ncbi:FecR family protein [Achromobacter xylosoxidans]|uniref:FecR family protein n=1 Tax=Alcaligenes xylosoxydans xylosoxydans TaxID=85698 RepID=UPI001F05AC2E|nr:FecR domain-containing protein [Achromobacter xylosoxidans]MCH1990057.1 FecR domain-containing protein [Achromobacter xylosoxidans]MCH4587673.1 FecR domain-containing protein [Achromobacter xylosoxidans]
MYSLSRPGRERRLRRQASQWALRLAAGALAPAEQRRLDRWLARDARHGPALADAERVWALAGECRGLPLFAQPVPRPRRSHWRACVASWWRSGPMAPWRRAVVMAGVALVVAGAAGAPDAVAPWLADYRSAVGEIRSFDLPDGSHVLLGSNSALDVEYDATTRRVRLLRGEAVFAPAPTGTDEPRRFVVATASGSMTALGTRYAVRRRDAGHGWIGVLQHRVEVALDRAPGSGVPNATLLTGESATYSHAGGIVRSQIEPARGAAWAEGYLVFDGEPLDIALQRIGEFRPGQLVLANRGAARRPVHALFHLDNLDGALATLCAEMHLKLMRLPGLTLLY